jgi:methanogenic corrinoid protein MtbC1
MDSFSISQLGQYAGVKPHTIRAWEKRYKALQPARSKGNTRYYDGSQMRRVLNIVSLIEAGYRVSDLCVMPDDQLWKLLNNFYRTNGNETQEYFISQLIAAGMTYDEAYFDQIFTRCLHRYKLKQAYLQVLLPMLNRIGMMWKCNKASVAHEHFISNILRQKLFSAVDSVPYSETGAPKWLLFLPENEFHDIGLLLAYNLIRLSGKHAIYLGSNVPLQVLRSAIEQIEPDNIFVFLVNRDYPKTLTVYLEELGQHFTAGNIYIANHNLARQARTQAIQRIRWLRTVEDLTALLTMN